MNTKHFRFDRRTLLRTAATTAAGVTFLPASAFGMTSREAPGARITLGIVGLGSRGFNLIDAVVKERDAQIVAACDVDSLHYRDRPWGEGTALGRDGAKQRIERAYARRTKAGQFRGLKLYADFRQLCARPDIDAVIVATPDHWHALIALEALRAGKDVYCEKPLTHRFHEGLLICREVEKRKAVFQVGSQQRSDSRFRRAVQLVRNGHIGKVQRVEVGLPTGYAGPNGDTTIKAPPEHVDYDFWCGPSPKLPYMQARYHRWWRGHLAFGGGVLMDWIGHHNDIAHWGLNMDDRGPVRVETVGWTFPNTDVYNSPHHYEIQCQYPGGVTSTIGDRNRGGTKWIGEDGWVFVTRGRLEASDARWTKPDFDPGPADVYQSPGHMRNFLDGVRSRKACVAPPATAHRSITPGHLGYVANTLHRALQWDSAQQRIVDDDEAQQLLMALTYRQPWQVPV